MWKSEYLDSDSCLHDPTSDKAEGNGWMDLEETSGYSLRKRKAREIEEDSGASENPSEISRSQVKKKKREIRQEPTAPTAGDTPGYNLRKRKASEVEADLEAGEKPSKILRCKVSPTASTVKSQRRTPFNPKKRRAPTPGVVLKNKKASDADPGEAENLMLFSEDSPEDSADYSPVSSGWRAPPEKSESRQEPTVLPASDTPGYNLRKRKASEVEADVEAGEKPSKIPCTEVLPTYSAVKSRQNTPFNPKKRRAPTPGVVLKKKKASDTDPGEAENLMLFSEDSPEDSDYSPVSSGWRAPPEKSESRQEPTVLPASDPDDFLFKYIKCRILGRGGHGAVFAGIRRADRLPVAMKYIEYYDADFIPVVIDGEEHRVPFEVVLMCRAGSDPDSVGQNPTVTLLDWFLLEEQVVLVMERPTPCESLYSYCQKNAPLPEQEAKQITAQVVDALVDLFRKKIFHQDLKTENVLIQSTPSGPRIKIIDFGCGLDVVSEAYDNYDGTVLFAPPEYRQTRRYFAGPATVWQIGMLVHELLSNSVKDELFFQSVKTGDIRNPPGLSHQCEGFLNACLQKDPNQRSGLMELPFHPWIQE